MVRSRRDKRRESRGRVKGIKDAAFAEKKCMDTTYPRYKVGMGEANKWPCPERGAMVPGHEEEVHRSAIL